jgi:Protein of unknown function (DUF2933)
MRSLLPFVFILICPLMMLFMMRGMHGRGAHSADQQARSDQQGMLAAGEDPQIVELRQQRDRLEARVDELEAQMNRIEGPREAESRVAAAR